MLRIRLAFFCNLGRNLHNLALVEAQSDLRACWGTIYTAQQALEQLLGTDWFLPALKTASESGHNLIAALKAITDRQIDFGGAVPDFVGHIKAYNLAVALSEFNTVLNAEFSHSDTFFVSQKAGFDTTVLIDSAERMFPADLGAKVPVAVQEIRAAGKCLAFEMPTAAGFHTMRALEAVVRVYCAAVGAEVPPADQRNLGVYVKNIEAKSGPDDPVVATLRQIKNLHRNPLVHDVTIDLREAVGLFGIANSAIGAMLKAIPAQGDAQLSFGHVAAIRGGNA